MSELRYLLVSENGRTENERTWRKIIAISSGSASRRKSTSLSAPMFPNGSTATAVLLGKVLVECTRPLFHHAIAAPQTSTKTSEIAIVTSLGRLVTCSCLFRDASEPVSRFRRFRSAFTSAAD